MTAIVHPKRTESLDSFFKKHCVFTIFDLYVLELMKKTVEEAAKRSPCSFIDVKNVCTCHARNLNFIIKIGPVKKCGDWKLNPVEADED